MLVHLPRENGYGLIPQTKNSPALAGYGAVDNGQCSQKGRNDPTCPSEAIVDLGPRQGAI